MGISHTRPDCGNDVVTSILHPALEQLAGRVRTASSLTALVVVILEGMRRVAMQLLEWELERRDRAFRVEGVERPCTAPKCNGKMRRDRKRKQVSRYTLLGKLKYHRTAWHCPICGRRCCPLDESLSLAAALRGHSEEFGSTLVLLCTLMPFGKGCALFERLCGFAVSTKLACALTLGVGTRLYEDEMQRAEKLWQERVDQPEKFEPCVAELRQMPRRKRVYVMMDNSKVGIQSGRRGRGAPRLRTLHKLLQEARRKAAKAAKRQKLGPEAAAVEVPPELKAAAADLHEDTWRDVRALLIFEEKDLATCSKNRRQILHRRVLAHVGTKEEWLKLVHMAFHEEGVYTAEEVVIVADGGSGIWELFDELLPSTNTRRVVQVLDWYHAASHLWAVGRALKGCKTDTERQACAMWVRPLLDYLAEGKVANVLQRLRKIDKASANAMDEIRKCIDYFDNHRTRMRYAWYRNQGMLIGSGAIESVHAWVIQPRCRLPGMRWSVPGANAMLRLRCSWASDRWDEDFARAARQPLSHPAATERNLMAAA